MELTTSRASNIVAMLLFMMSKIQNLNGTHNADIALISLRAVVYDVKDTKFEWNSQQIRRFCKPSGVVYDVKDTKFEWNSQQVFACCYVLQSCL